MCRLALLLTAALAAGCGSVEVPLADLRSDMLGREVVVTMKPQNVFVSIGLPAPPGMCEIRNSRWVFHGVLTAIDEETVRLEPPERFPKTFAPEGLLLHDEEGKEFKVEGPLNYLSWQDVRREQIESVRLVGRRAAPRRTRPAPPAP